MSFQMELEECYALLDCNRIMDRRKAMEKITDLLNNTTVIESLNKENPFSWNSLLQASQVCLRKECEKIADTTAKKGPQKGPDKNFELSKELMCIIVKTAVKQGENKIKLSKLVKYIDGCLKEKKMKICRNNFLLVLKEIILPNPNCIGFLEQEDFMLLFSMLKSAFEVQSELKHIDTNCFMLLIKHGPLAGLSPNFLREQFPLISKLCRSVTQNASRTYQEDVMETLLNFCNHTVEDNRVSCIKLGEEVFQSLLDLYFVAGHDSVFKVNVIKFCLLQITIHNPNGASEGEPNACASNWHNWKVCIKQMYKLLTYEISNYLRQCVKNTQFFVTHEKSTVILDSFVSLFVEVCKQIFKDTDSPMNYTLTDNLDSTSQSQKRRKVEANLESFVSEIQETKSWVWIKLVGALIKKYSLIIDEKLYIQLLHILQTLQLEVKDNNTINYIYECQSVLLYVEQSLNIENKLEVQNLWKLVGDSTLRAVGLNQNVKATQTLLQDLIDKNIINLDAVIQTYTSGVLSISEHHLNTLELVLQNTNFSQLEASKKEELFNSLLNSQNIKDYKCLLKPNFAKILVTLMLKQCPENETKKEEPCDPYKILKELYAKSYFNTEYVVKADQMTGSKNNTRTYNVDAVVATAFMQKIKKFVENPYSESIENLLCILGLLYNLLSYMVTYKVIDKERIVESQPVALIVSILNNEKIHDAILTYQTHNEKILKKILDVAYILNVIFSIRNNVTDIVKNLFHTDFFSSVFDVVNFFQNVSEKKADIEHQVKKSLTQALSMYCLVSNGNTILENQQKIMLALAKPDYDFRTETDYDLSIGFLKKMSHANPGFIPAEAVAKILTCLHGICEVRYHSYLSALDILNVLKDLYKQMSVLLHDDDEIKKIAVLILHNFFIRQENYGPDISIAILNCIKELCVADPDCTYSVWEGKEIIKFVPQFLASHYQKVRYRAIEVLVEFFKVTSGTTRLQNVHRLEEIFLSMYEMNLKVFEVEGDLTNERRADEILFRGATALHSFLSLMVNCNSWAEESLFAIIKLEHHKKLGLVEKVFMTLKRYFVSDDFLKKYLETILNKWISAGYEINDFEFKFFNATDKMDLYIKYFDICLPLLLRTDRNDLFKVAKHLNMTEKDVLERCSTNIFGKSLSKDINNVGDQFLERNVEVSYLYHVLGTRLNEILIENIDQLILILLSGITDEKLIYEQLGETIIFTTKGISYSQFVICLKYIENFLCKGRNFIKFLCAGMHKIQNILLNLEVKIYNAVDEEKIKCFHQYIIMVDLLLESIVKSDELLIFILRDTIHFLINLIKNNLHDNKLSGAVIKYFNGYLRKIVPEHSVQFEHFLIFIVNSIKNFALVNDNILGMGICILEFLIIENARPLVNTIQKLDAFPQKPEFEKIRIVHNNIKYGNKEISVKDEITSFLENSDIDTRQDSLVHLKNILAKEKKQLKVLYDNLNQIRGFSEDCENSLLHRLTSMLVKMSCFPNESVSFEAVRCLGEIGPANLTTLVLKPEERIKNIKCSAFELLTGHVISLLTQYIIDSDVNVMRTASEALYFVLRCKEGKKVVESRIDFGYGKINKSFIIPYTSTSHNSSQVRVNFEMFSSGINDSDLWCPMQEITNNEWVKSLVISLLHTFDTECYLKHLIPICNEKVKFCESILPLLIYLLLSLKNTLVKEILCQQINKFFSQHWNLTISTTTDQNLIPVNKKSVKCMLDVINFVRQQSSFLDGLGKLKFDYLPISKAAAFCSAHFTALLYAELWCQEKMTTIEQGTPRDGAPFENGYTLLDFIYENVSEEIGITLQSILQSAYKAIGDLDALSGCGITFLLRPEYRVEHYKNIGQWDHVMHYYSMQPYNSSDTSQTHLIESFKMNRLYQLPLLCSNMSEEPQYECLWRLGQWSTKKKDTLKPSEVNPEHYEKYKFYSLKALCDNDQYTFTESKKQLSSIVINNLKHTSLESSKNLYPILSQLQSLVEMEDFVEAVEKQGFERILNKWKLQDNIIRKNDFQFVEPIAAQRMTMLSEHVKKHPQLRQCLFEMVLNFADYAKDECNIRAVESAIINIQKDLELSGDIKNELQFREAQLAWLNNDKVIAQQLLRKLCKNDNITSRLKANALKLQGEYMVEMYLDRTTILNSFSECIHLLRGIVNQLTIEDHRNLEDTFDKIATFADREYQQIMTHIKSAQFQKKISNMKNSRDMAKSICEQRKKTEDERKAAVFHERQSKIDENEINTIIKDKDFVLCLALKFYLKNLSMCDTNNIKIFRVMSLFLENRDNQKLTDDINKRLPKIPTYKHITMLPQLIPHISEISPDLFSIQINQIIERCAIDHPHHTLPLLLALVNSNKDREYSNSKTKTSPNDRIITASNIIKKLKKKAELSEMILRMQALSDALIELAYYVDCSGTKSAEYSIPSKLKIHKIKNFDNVLVPTYTLPVSKNNTYSNIIGIFKFMPTYKTVGGINAPKRIECQCSLGIRRPQLVKGQDDLRQDAVMQQVFTIMTNLLSSNKQTRNLLIRTYKIVPLSMRSGILEWVPNSMPIGDYLAGTKEDGYSGAHKEFRPQDRTPNDCRNAFKKCIGKTNEQKLKIFNAICKDLKPVFHKFFETHFPQPSVWYERKRAYIHSVATTSMCGYILGIGDRHVSNILVDKQTAEVIHIDFGIAFEQAKCLPTPETVPFRLSRDIVDGMGVSGIEGLFRKSCEKTMEVLRANSQTILTILEVLLYDPLYFWTVSSAEANKRQTDDEFVRGIAEESEEENKNISAERALLRLRGKLLGTEEGKPTSVEQQVGTLIQQAVDPVNLCRLFNGWQPYL